MRLSELPLSVARFLISFPAFRPSNSISVRFGHFSPTAVAKLSRAAFLASGFGLLNSSAQPAFDLLHLDFLVPPANRNTHRSLARVSGLPGGWGRRLRHPTFTGTGGSPAGIARESAVATLGSRGRLKRFLIPPEFPFLGSEVALPGRVGCASSRGVKPKLS